MYKVLLVDDEPATIDTERRVIERKLDNFHVIGEAYSVDEALEIYEQEHPDVILTDIKMPGKNGTELINYITNREDNSTICIAVSGYADFNYVHDAFLSGAFDYLLKPVNPKKLVELFQRTSQYLVSNGKKAPAAVLPNKKLGGKKLVEEIEQYLKMNITGDNSILAICKRFSISQPYLSRIFKMYCDCTYNEYLIELKIREAKRLLEQKDEEYRIGEVAELAGFSDQFYFSKVFKNATGLSPREYRNEI